MRTIFCYILPGTDDVKLGFNLGSCLADHKGVLSGRARDAGSLVISSRDQIDADEIGSFVTQAASLNVR